MNMNIKQIQQDIINQENLMYEKTMQDDFYYRDGSYHLDIKILRKLQKFLADLEYLMNPVKSASQR